MNIYIFFVTNLLLTAADSESVQKKKALESRDPGLILLRLRQTEI